MSYLASFRGGPYPGYRAITRGIVLGTRIALIVGMTINRFTCGHESSEPGWGNDIHQYPFVCSECRNARIGEKIEFVRHGTPPSSGYSVNHRDGTTEDGVSVYEVKNGTIDYVGWYFDISDRPMFRGFGIIVGFGSDHEPVVKILSIKKSRRG